MITFSFDLDDPVANALVAQANEMGISPEDWLRFRVGEALQFFHQRAASLPRRAASLPPDSASSPPLDAPEVAFARMAALMGQLNCKGCTQKLNLKDVKDGSCEKCGTEVFK